MSSPDLRALSDADVLAGVHRYVRAGQHALVRLLRLLAEAEARRLPQAEGHGSLFAMCRALGFSEGESNWRVRAARLGRRVPQVLDMLEVSTLSLTTAVALAPVLNRGNAERLLCAAAGRCRADVEALVAAEGGVAPARRDRIVACGAALAPPSASAVDAANSAASRGVPAAAAAAVTSTSEELRLAWGPAPSGERPRRAVGPASSELPQRLPVGAASSEVPQRLPMGPGSFEVPQRLLVDLASSGVPQRPNAATACAAPPSVLLAGAGMPQASFGVAPSGNASRSNTACGGAGASQPTFRAHFDLDAETRALLRRAMALAPARRGGTSAGAVIKAALQAYVVREERRKFGLLARPARGQATAGRTAVSKSARDMPASQNSGMAVDRNPVGGREASAGGSIEVVAPSSAEHRHTVAPAAPQRLAVARTAAQRLAVAPAAEKQLVGAPAGEQRLAVAPAAEKRPVGAPAGEQWLAVAPTAEQRLVGAPVAEQRPAASPSAAAAPADRRRPSLPRGVRREVFVRDEGRCTFVARDGRRCSATSALEYDHIVPFAHGGGHTAANLRLLCRQHNVLAAERIFGMARMAAARSEGSMSAAQPHKRGAAPSQLRCSAAVVPLEREDAAHRSNRAANANRFQVTP